MNYIEINKIKNKINTLFLENALAANATEPFSLERSSLINLKETKKKGYIFIKEGTVTKILSRPDGNIQFNLFYSFNDILGLIEPVDIPSFHFEYRAMTDITGFWIFLDWANQYIGENSELMIINLQREIFWKDLINKLLSLGATEKVYYLLIIISEYRFINEIATGRGIPKFVTHDVLSKVCGISREQVSRIISRLKKQGVVKGDKNGGLIIVNSLYLENSLDIDFNSVD
ncbi:Crp/Fnr family transcriptional regulator [Listeria booriae]|uniref:Crp/Fnr family transcriptional regulator n=1 Tax=Listeria booriae TaxID=1552123 RepID=UPI0016247EDE|nr:Crp/Fnr family transcriptional regulator [Listeria booriae]MBC1911886.1 Crp/Fnr family transcriptional regulator [Listeria booriae]